MKLLLSEVFFQRFPVFNKPAYPVELCLSWLLFRAAYSVIIEKRQSNCVSCYSDVGFNALLLYISLSVFEGYDVRTMVTIVNMATPGGTLPTLVNVMPWQRILKLQVISFLA